MRRIIILLALLSMMLLAEVSSSSAQALDLEDYLNVEVVQDRGKPGKGKPPKEEQVKYKLYLEIDYMEGHTPTLSVLTYIVNYYAEEGVEVIIIADYYDEQGEFVDDLDSQNVGYYSYLTRDGFWDLENNFNDIVYQNDRAQDLMDTDGDGYDGEYFLREKWILYGSRDINSNIMGYTSVTIGIEIRGNRISGDVLAGNYIFIADVAADQWAVEMGIESYGGEAVVLMHEIGHSIGVGILEYGIFGWTEIYDPDTSSVMSTLNINNAARYYNWYYSRRYWRTKNLEYYQI